MVRQVARTTGQGSLVGKQQVGVIDVDRLGDEDEIDAVGCLAWRQIVGMECWWALAVERISQAGPLSEFAVQRTCSGDVEVSANHRR